MAQAQVQEREPLHVSQQQQQADVKKDSSNQEPVNGRDNESDRKYLYVGDLEPNVSEVQIYELFQGIGPLLSVRICRDVTTQISLGYAYVNYSTPENASEALRSLNFTPLNGKPIRIMYSQRDPSIRKSGSGNLFIKNLDKGVDNKTLYDKFSVFGPILSSKVATDAFGNSKGYGFVHFEQDEAAQNAIKNLNGVLINDKPISVGPFIKKEEREAREREQAKGETKFNNVFVNNLSESMNDEDLRFYFGHYGKITSVAVMRDAAGKSKCFGFVNFENADDAATCVDSLNGKKIDGRQWYVGKALKKSELKKQSGTNLYLKYLDQSIDDNKLRELFSIYGTISSCKIMRDFDGQSKGSGFVAFSSPDEASLAIAEMNRKIVMGKPLYVALAQRKEERKTELQCYFSQLSNQVRMAPAPAPAPAPTPAPTNPANASIYNPGDHRLNPSSTSIYNPRDSRLNHPHFPIPARVSIYNPAHLHPPLRPEAPAAFPLPQHQWGLNQVRMAMAPPMYITRHPRLNHTLNQGTFYDQRPRAS